MKFYIYCISLLWLAGGFSFVQANEVGDLSLADVLEQARSRHRTSAQDPGELDTHTFLGASPKLYAMHLGSGDVEPAETEVGISLDFMSLSKHRISGKYRAIQNAIDDTVQRNLNLYLSGQIRDVLWNSRFADAKLQRTRTQIGWLEQVESLMKARAEAGASTRMALIRVQLELNQLQQEFADASRLHETSIRRYRNLTGLEQLPSEIKESLSTDNMVTGAHPMLQVIELNQRLAVLNLKSQAADQADWNLSVYQKQVDLPGTRDRQLGVSVEVPISIGQTYSAGAYQSWKKTAADLNQEYIELQTRLGTELEQLQQEYHYLQKNNSLLTRKAELARALTADLEQQRNSSSISLDQYYKRLIEIKDTQFQVTLNDLELARNIARQNQILGISL